MILPQETKTFVYYQSFRNYFIFSLYFDVDLYEDLELVFKLFFYSLRCIKIQNISD